MTSLYGHWPAQSMEHLGHQEGPEGPAQFLRLVRHICAPNFLDDDNQKVGERDAAVIGDHEGFVAPCGHKPGSASTN